MRVGSLVVAAAIMASPIAEAQAPTELTVGTRRPFAFLLGTPTGEGGRTSSSEIIRTVSDILRADTNLELELLDSSLMRACRGRLVCLTLKARQDYDREALLRADGEPLPFRAHVRAMRERGTAYPKYLFVLSNVTIAGQADRMSAVLVNTDLALAYYHEAERDAPDWEDAVEAKINVAAVVSPPARAEVAGPAEAQAFLRELFEQKLVQAFEATGNWRPYGEVELRGAPADAIVYLDGAPLGATGPERTRLRQVDPGRRALRLEHPGHLPFSSEVVVRRGEVADLSVTMVAREVETSALPRQVTLWTGAAMVVAGVGLSIYGATKPQSDLRTVCIEPTECTDGRRFITFGYDPEQDDPRAINPSGVMIVPLGYSLAGAGATFSLGALLTDEGDLPWISWVAGAAVGALAYGVSAAVAGP